MCTLVSMIGQSCVDSRAGLYRLFAIATSKIDTITWDADQQITAITVVDPLTDFWTQVDPAKDTAFFTQEMTKVRNSKNYVQTLSFNRDGVSLADYMAIQGLADCCGVTIAAFSNDGTARVFGVEYTDGTLFKDIQLKAISGFANSGTDPVSEFSERQLVFAANSGKEAPLTSLAESSFPLS